MTTPTGVVSRTDFHRVRLRPKTWMEWLRASQPIELEERLMTKRLFVLFAALLIVSLPGAVVGTAEAEEGTKGERSGAPT